MARRARRASKVTRDALKGTGQEDAQEDAPEPQSEPQATQDMPKKEQS